LESIQKKARFTIKEKDLHLISMTKRNLRIQKYGSDASLIIAISVKYIDSDETLKNLLCLSKEINRKARN
jgi:hypothetical protein